MQNHEFMKLVPTGRIELDVTWSRSGAGKTIGVYNNIEEADVAGFSNTHNNHSTTPHEIVYSCNFRSFFRFPAFFKKSKKKIIIIYSDSIHAITRCVCV